MFFRLFTALEFGVVSSLRSAVSTGVDIELAATAAVAALIADDSEFILLLFMEIFLLLRGAIAIVDRGGGDDDDDDDGTLPFVLEFVLVGDGSGLLASFVFSDSSVAVSSTKFVVETLVETAMRE